VQICVTNTCNRSAGDSVRWNKTIEEYKNLLKFVCTLYWAVEKNEMDVCKIGDKTVREYIVQMYTNSDIIHNKETGRKQEFLKFPTMIVPSDFLYYLNVEKQLPYTMDERIKLLIDKTKDNPLRRNYEFAKDIGMYMNNYKGNAELIKYFIKKIFDKRENIVEKVRLDYYLDTGEEINLIPEPISVQPVQVRAGRRFGNTPQPNVIELFQGLPSIATMERRIQRMDDLLLEIPYQKPLVQRLLEFIESTSKSSISEKRNNEQIKNKLPTSQSKTSIISRLFNTKQKIIPQ
jgi:hypothetical protein